MRVKTGRYQKLEDKDTICLLYDSGEIKSEMHFLMDCFYFGDKMWLCFNFVQKIVPAIRTVILKNMISPRCTEHPLMYSWYPLDVLMVFLRCTEHPPMYSWYPPHTSWYTPDVLHTPNVVMISPDVLMVSPNVLNNQPPPADVLNIPRWTEHTLYRVQTRLLLFQPLSCTLPLLTANLKSAQAISSWRWSQSVLHHLVTSYAANTSILRHCQTQF